MTSFDVFGQEYWQGGYDTGGPSTLKRFHLWRITFINRQHFTRTGWSWNTLWMSSTLNEGIALSLYVSLPAWSGLEKNIRVSGKFFQNLLGRSQACPIRTSDVRDYVTENLFCPLFWVGGFYHGSVGLPETRIFFSRPNHLTARLLLPHIMGWVYFYIIHSDWDHQWKANYKTTEYVPTVNNKFDFLCVIDKLWYEEKSVCIVQWCQIEVAH